jgi:hypothetical protein
VTWAISISVGRNAGGGLERVKNNCDSGEMMGVSVLLAINDWNSGGALITLYKNITIGVSVIVSEKRRR